MDKIKCLIVDDEPIAREGLAEHVEQIDFLKLIATCKNAIEATNWMQKSDVDLIFLDIQMPKVTGIEFVKNLKNPPLTVFTTAYPEYAIESYELDIVDYLLKPISFPRFMKAALKAKEILAQHEPHQISNDGFFFVKCSQKIEKIIVQDITYVESMSNYVIIHTKDKKYMTYLTFKSVEDQLPSDQFIRIHRSYMVALNAIKTIEGSDLILEGATLPISKNYKDEVMLHIEKFLFKR